MIIRMKKSVLALAASAALCGVAFADGVKLSNKWATSDYTYYDDPKHPTMVQCYNDPKTGPAIATATSDEVVAAVASDEAKMRELCSKVAAGYQTDPVAACQIAALSVWVMANAGDPWYVFWRSSRESERAKWVDVLLSSAGAASDEYVVSYFLDQVRWCGSKADAAKVKALGEAKKSSVHIREMADMVADELDSL